MSLPARALVLLAGLLAAGGAAGSQAAVLRVAQPVDLRSLNPMFDESVAAEDLSDLLYSRAVRYDQRGRPVPDLLARLPSLENGDLREGGRTIVFRLRHNVFWHDGVQLTSRDLRFTWRAVMNDRNRVPSRAGFDLVAAIDAHDPFAAIIHFKQVYADYLNMFGAHAPVLPAHILARADARGTLSTDAFNSAPVGSGPFKLDRWKRGEEVRLAAFDRYFRGRPKLDGVVVRTVRSRNTLLTLTQTHEIDMPIRAGAGLLAAYKALPGMRVATVPLFAEMKIDLNLTRPFFADVRVRRALASAIDKRTIVRVVAHGLGDVADADQSPVLSWAFTAATAHYRYDPKIAENLLTQAGWLPGPDGVRVKAGRRFAFELSAAAGSNSGQELVAQYWNAIGAEVTIRSVEPERFSTIGPGAILNRAGYDALLLGYTATPDPDDSTLYAADQISPHGANTIFWTDAAATTAMHAALRTTERARRKREYALVQRRIADQVPFIALYFLRQPYVYPAKLRGFKPSPLGPFWNAWELRL